MSAAWSAPIFFVAALVLAAVAGFLPLAVADVRRRSRRNREDHSRDQA